MFAAAAWTATRGPGDRAGYTICREYPVNLYGEPSRFNSGPQHCELTALGRGKEDGMAKITDEKGVSDIAVEIAEIACDESDQLGRLGGFPEAWFAKRVDAILLKHAQGDEGSEIFQLRRRLEQTEDALRRELRKRARPARFECHKCGAVNEVQD